MWRYEPEVRMKLLTTQIDRRIDATNVLVEMAASEYVDIAKEILHNNEFQRRRVKSSGTVYAMLKEDLTKGCLIPPLVLATTTSVDHTSIDAGTVETVLSDVSRLVILDGLQRTYLLIELSETESRETLDDVVIRVEIYLNIDEMGILYRMLTLNTGQTPMSLRHQIEILYSHYLEDGIEGLKIIRQVDPEAKRYLGEYNFSDLIDGYHAYLQRNELPIDKFDLLDAIKSLEGMSRDQAASGRFEQFAQIYNRFVTTVQNQSGDWRFPADEEGIPPEYRLTSTPFGAEPFKIFNKAQAISGFGSAVGKLIDLGQVDSLDDVEGFVESINTGSPEVVFPTMLQRLDQIRNESKKIGTAQRVFFHHLFRGLLDRDNDATQDLLGAVEYGYRRYQAQLG